MNAILKEENVFFLNTFFRNKVMKLHIKDTILHVTDTFSLKQPETRTSSGPINLSII